MSYVEANTKGRERLRALAEELTDEKLALQVGDGWTVAATLAHLAFWDYRVLLLLRHWRDAEVGRSPIDIDGINDSMKPLCLAIPGREAASLAVKAAEAVDAELARLPEDLMAEIGTLVQHGTLWPDRSIHRHWHLDQIERALAESR